MTGMATSTANAFLAALCRGEAYSVGSLYVQLHIGEPGPTGTWNGAVETLRQAVTFDAPYGGHISSNVDLTWNNIMGSENATYFSVWDAAEGGNFLFSGANLGSKYDQGDSYTIPAGALTASLTTTT